jgi:hypothetical protein
MEKLKQGGSGNVPALMFTMPEAEHQGKGYTVQGADIQRKKALMFLAGLCSGKTYPQIKDDYKKVGV